MMGRPILGPELVEHATTHSDRAKLVTRTILETIAGTCTIAQAGERLACNRAYVHVLRQRLLDAMLDAAEPRTPGPVPKPAPDPVLSSALLDAQKRLKDAEVALELERLRTEMVQVFGQRPTPKKKRRHRR
jgi:hypothetical protein